VIRSLFNRYFDKRLSDFFAPLDICIFVTTFLRKELCDYFYVSYDRGIANVLMRKNERKYQLMKLKLSNDDSYRDHAMNVGYMKSEN